ncbi:D-2-hydroxyacid dehydrogenase [Halorarum halophilum]|uniref:D-2-hydroxyacid dehydrogenase n=1 Tax=Halorarum halophilum TaxID=2743090 RepID=A0A7D5GWX9_9EURY|nr:D-2-hydroxyacid dehydrogenase [Halobaculum halophilum]QLG27309.1 D-2-hydroxyacid dehydrogenase [Halobaculum halophilum]
MTESPDIVVLRRAAHGMSTTMLAEAIRERLPDYEVVRPGTPAGEREAAAEAPVIVGHGIDEELLEAAEELELFACFSAGVGHLPQEELAARGVAVTNASGVHGPNIAEQVIGNVLAFVRNLHVGWERQRNHEWRHYQGFPRELGDSTVTVVGLGPIGQAIVERLDAFGPHLIGVRYTPGKGGPTDEVLGFDGAEFHDALARTDYLVLACPLTETTRGLVGRAEFETLPPHAVLVNVGRGPIVDTEALTDAIKDNAIRGAALDVTDPEPLPSDHDLWRMGNVHITPHNSGYTPQYYPRVADILARNLGRVEETGSYDDLENQVV